MNNDIFKTKIQSIILYICLWTKVHYIKEICNEIDI